MSGQLCTTSDKTCDRCEKIFVSKWHLERHLGRKTPCAVVSPSSSYNCTSCNRRFTSRQGVYQHTRGGHCPAALALTASQASVVAIDQQDESRLGRLESTLAKISESMSMLATASTSNDARRPTDAGLLQVNQSICTHQVVNAPITQTITINAFGSEDAGHIGRAEIKAILDEVLATTNDPTQGARQALQRAAMLLYSDPQHPANLTCYTPNKKEDGVRVKSQTGKWELLPYSAVNPPLVTRSTNLLFSYQPFDDAERYSKLMQALRDNEPAYKLGKDLHMVLYRNKEILFQALGEHP